MFGTVENSNRHGEKGFVMVTAMVLLAILTVLGVASAYKTVVEVKMSRVSGDSAKALEAANAAIHKQFYEWAMDDTSGGGTSDGDREEFADLITNVQGDAGAVGIYLPTLLPNNITALISAASDDLDSYIQNNTFFRVYNVTPLGVSQTANSNWDPQSTVPQVAIWVTSFNVPVKGGVPDPDEYPYKEPCGVGGVACDGNSSIAINAVGRFRDAKRLVRQLVSTAVSPVLSGVNAITNAPMFNSWHDACQGSSSSSNNDANWPAGNAADWNTIIDATQAIYTLGDADNGIPSGTAIASNSNASNGSLGGGGTTESELVMSMSPLVAYSGHAPVEGVRVRHGSDSEEPDGSKTLTQSDSKLPRYLVPTQLLGTDNEISYFLDGNSQLFDLDVFRWGAEQFTCQNAGTANAAGNGAYCAKAEALRAAVDDAMPGVIVNRPVTGRLSLADFEYNVSNAIPMFGLVRVMYPTLQSDDADDLENCDAFGTIVLHELDDGETEVIGHGANAVDPHPWTSGFNVETIAPGNGRFTQYSAGSKIIVYGMLMFDYFSDRGDDDTPANGLYDPDNGGGSTGEYLLLPMEAYGITHAINVPVIVNPALPRTTARGIGDTDARFPTAAASAAPTGSASDLADDGLMNTGSSDNAPGLASPYDGWFPADEGMLNLTSATAIEGTMQLMEQSTTSGLVKAMVDMHDQTTNVISTEADSLYTNAKGRLGYYHELNKVTLDQGNAQFWPISTDLPDDLTSDSFCIGEQDCDGDDDHPGDRLHLLFPSGYTHGWKVALAALNMTADEWNALLTGNGGRDIATLRTTHATPVSPGDGTYPAGSPFGALDTGYTAANVGDIQAASASYFQVDEDATTGYGELNASFRDIPALIFSGGRIALNYHLNLSGITYTAGGIEWAAGGVGCDPDRGLSYVIGAEVTGFGSYTRNDGTTSPTVPDGCFNDARFAIAYDPVAVDYINTNQSAVIIMRTYGWQELF